MKEVDQSSAGGGFIGGKDEPNLNPVSKELLTGYV
jgi:hypothetical protein